MRDIQNNQNNGREDGKWNVANGRQAAAGRHSAEVKQFGSKDLEKKDVSLDYSQTKIALQAHAV